MEVQFSWVDADIGQGSSNSVFVLLPGIAAKTVGGGGPT